VAAATLLLVY